MKHDPGLILQIVERRPLGQDPCEIPPGPCGTEVLANPAEKVVFLFGRILGDLFKYLLL